MTKLFKDPYTPWPAIAWVNSVSTLLHVSAR